MPCSKPSGTRSSRRWFRRIADGLDAIYLSLHGAMVTTELEDPEGELLARIRAMPGAREAADLLRVCDLHATLTPRDGRLVATA